MLSEEDLSDSELSETRTISTPEVTPVKRKASAQYDHVNASFRGVVINPDNPYLNKSHQADAGEQDDHTVVPNEDSTASTVCDSSHSPPWQSSSGGRRDILDGNAIDATVPDNAVAQGQATSRITDETQTSTLNAPVRQSRRMRNRIARDNPVAEEAGNEEQPRSSPTPAVDSPQLGKRKRKETAKLETFHFEPPYSAANCEDKNTWGGFCELESDPAVFNNVLHNLGIEGVKLQEVYSLDEELLDMLPKPVHGLIFLFQYTAEADAAEAQASECPGNIWFANQVVDNCCGTIALLNVINNIQPSELLLSSQFRRFKEFTAAFPPTFRGDQVANCDFIKQAHNAYARQVDMWNADLTLEENCMEGQKKKKSKSKRRGGNRKGSRKAQTDSAFHFVAYMPVDGEMWRLDGLDEYPQSFGPVTSGSQGWLMEIAPHLSARMMAYAEDGVQFSLLAIVRDEAAAGRLEFAKTVHLLSAIEAKLTTMNHDWRVYAEMATTQDLPTDQADVSLLLDSATEDRAAIQDRLRKFDDLDSLLELHSKTSKQHSSLLAQLQSTTITRTVDSDVMSEEVRARDRQSDYVPFIQKWLMLLAENQRLKELVELHG